MARRASRTSTGTSSASPRGVDFERRRQTDSAVAGEDARNLRRGFTIVELLIVIVVIAILATIVMIAYNGISKRALNTVRLADMKAWVQNFELYRANHGGFPGYGPTDTRYCLGTGFPVGYNSERRCRDYVSSDPEYSYTETGSAALRTELEKAGKVSGGNHTPVAGWLVGPWVEFYPTVFNHIRISTAIDSEDPQDCVNAGFKSTWMDPDSSAQICTYTFENAW